MAKQEAPEPWMMVWEPKKMVPKLVVARVVEMVWWILLVVTCLEEVAGRCLWLVVGAEMWHVGRLG